MSAFDDLRQRSFSALLMIPIPLVFLAMGGWWALILVGALMGLVMREFGRMAGVKRASLETLLMVLTGVLAVLAVWDSNWLLALASLAVSGVLYIVTPRADGLRAFGSLYVAAACAGFLAIRLGMGFWPMLWVILIVIATDVGGYFAGKRFGGPKFWPRVSPNKTWAGMIGGQALALLVTLIYALIMGWPLGGMLFASILAATAAQAGDLLESALKRIFAVKDSGTMFPGHGGLMDRIDGLGGAALAVSGYGALTGLFA
ncbi:phosphatidate cytidylyltransferase [Paracoccaceae bacterium GXU_MW_L88]